MLKRLLALTTSLSLLVLPLQALAAPAEEPTSMSLEERRAVYAERSSNALAAGLWNLVPFGTGSFLQGDITGGVSILAVDTLALVMTGWAFLELDSGSGWTWVYQAHRKTPSFRSGI
ncbi:MAG: P13 family porin [Candidatus Sericytochromatia bacterium]|nr:P13 family porin [Candidatus Sericytochromatia bacterium]